jgi:predicted amidophosphoribosyltransferase
MNWTVLAINLAVAAPAAYWTYRDAKGRDANSILWAATIILAGLFFLGPLGPLGTVIILLIYSIVRPKGAMRTCPHCNKKELSWLAFCPHCKGVLKRDCYRCFAAVDVENEFCPHCRAKLG